MFSNFVDNLPKVTKKQETMRNIHLEGLKNNNKDITENFDKFDYFVHPILFILLLVPINTILM